MDLGERAARLKFLIRDRDSKFTAEFDEVFVGSGVRVIKTPVRTPRANSLAERYVGTLRRECLRPAPDLRQQRLRQILAEYSQRSNEHRPRHHGNNDLRCTARSAGRWTSRIKRGQAVHGLISGYRRAA